MSVPNCTLPIISFNNPIVTTIGSTQADANIFLYGSNNPSIGYSIGVNNTGFYILGYNIPTRFTIGPVNTISTAMQQTLNVVGNINTTNLYNNDNLIVDSNKTYYPSIQNNYSTLNQSINSNINVLGANFGIYRNHVINGAMNLDSLNTALLPVVMGLPYSITSILDNTTLSYIGYIPNVQPKVVNTVNNWNMSGSGNSASLVATNIPLSTADINTTGGKFINAVSLSTLPTNGLISYLPFTNTLNDSLGYLTVSSSSNIKYSSCNAYVGNFCIDFTSNVVGATTKPVTSVTYNLPTSSTSCNLTYNFASNITSVATYTTAALQVMNSDSLGNTYAGGSWGPSTSISLTNLNGTVSGYTLPTVTRIGAFIVKYNSSGNVIGYSYVNSFATDSIQDIYIDTTNNVYIVGLCSSNANLENTIDIRNIDSSASITGSYFPGNSTASGFPFILKYNSLGAFQAYSYYGVPPNGPGNAFKLSITGSATNGNIFVSYSASTTNTAIALRNIDSTASVSAFTPSTGAYSIIVRYDINGSVTGFITVPTTIPPSVTSIYNDINNNLYICGTRGGGTAYSLGNFNGVPNNGASGAGSTNNTLLAFSTGNTWYGGCGW